MSSGANSMEDLLDGSSATSHSGPSKSQDSLDSIGALSPFAESPGRSPGDLFGDSQAAGDATAESDEEDAPPERKERGGSVKEKDDKNLRKNLAQNLKNL